jgi:hypothetical protein
VLVQLLQAGLRRELATACATMQRIPNIQGRYVLILNDTIMWPFGQSAAVMFESVGSHDTPRLAGACCCAASSKATAHSYLKQLSEQVSALALPNMQLNSVTNSTWQQLRNDQALQSCTPSLLVNPLLYCCSP